MFGKSGRNEAWVPSGIDTKHVRCRTGRRTVVAGAALALSLLAASAAQAQQTCSNGFLTGGGAAFGAGPLAASPAALASMIGTTITTASSAFLLQSTAFVGSPANPSPYQQGGGIWIRGVGGEVDVKSNSSSIGTTPPPTPNSTNISCVQKIHQNFGGVQLGTDISRLNINGWNVHWGTTAGYLEARSNIVGGGASVIDINPGGGPPNINVGGGEFTATTQVPFAGTYAAATKGGFYVDGLLRAEYYQNNLNAPGMNLFSQNLDAHGWSFSASTGYQWQVPNSRWFVEPSAGVIFSRIKVDPFNFASAGTPGFSDFNGTLQVDQIKSDIGRIGARVGTTISSGNLILQPFGAVSVWHEFGPNVTSVYQTCSARTGGGGCLFLGGPTIFSSSISNTTFGTYGQYSLGFSAAVADTGWLAFARVDYRKGTNLESFSGTGGVRYQFTPEKSRRVTKDSRPGVEVVSWSGFYLGGFGSALLGTADWKYVGGTATPHVGGYSFGGDIGYNYQIGRWVLGVEAELGKTNLLGSTACGPLLSDPTDLGPAAPFFQMTCNAWANWIGTATGRVGYAWERVLLYVKGGGAWTREYVSATCNLGPNNPIDFVQTPGQACTNPKEAISNGLAGSTNTRGGWVVGYGTEFALTRNWSARAEYNYISFGDRTVIASDGSALNIGMHVSEAKVGLNYRFDSGAVYR
jgi:opacity protein-like surface antigen